MSEYTIFVSTLDTFKVLKKNEEYESTFSRVDRRFLRLSRENPMFITVKSEWRMNPIMTTDENDLERILNKDQMSKKQQLKSTLLIVESASARF